METLKDILETLVTGFGKALRKIRRMFMYIVDRKHVTEHLQAYRMYIAAARTMYFVELVPNPRHLYALMQADATIEYLLDDNPMTLGDYNRIMDAMDVYSQLQGNAYDKFY